MTLDVQSSILIVQFHPEGGVPELATLLHLPQGITPQNPELKAKLEEFKLAYLTERKTRLGLPPGEAGQWVVFYVEPPVAWLRIPDVETGVAVLKIDRQKSMVH